MLWSKKREFFPVRQKELERLNQATKLAYQQWQLGEARLNNVEEQYLEAFTYEGILKKQIYRYYLRKLKEYYGGRDRNEGRMG